MKVHRLCSNSLYTVTYFYNLFVSFLAQGVLRYFQIPYVFIPPNKINITFT